MMISKGFRITKIPWFCGPRGMFLRPFKAGWNQNPQLGLVVSPGPAWQCWQGELPGASLPSLSKGGSSKTPSWYPPCSPRELLLPLACSGWTVLMQCCDLSVVTSQMPVQEPAHPSPSPVFNLQLSAWSGNICLGSEPSPVPSPPWGTGGASWFSRAAGALSCPAFCTWASLIQLLHLQFVRPLSEHLHPGLLLSP